MPRLEFSAPHLRHSEAHREFIYNCLEPRMSWRIGMYIAAALLLAAHFLRDGNIVAVALCLAAPLLFLYRRWWVLIVLQLMAYGAAATWIITLLRIVELRQITGRSWTAAALILGSVALLTLLAGVLLNSRAFRERYPR